LETSFSSIETHCKKKLNTGSQNDNNHQKNIPIIDEQVLLDECTGEVIIKKELLLTS